MQYDVIILPGLAKSPFYKFGGKRTELETFDFLDFIVCNQRLVIL